MDIDYTNEEVEAFLMEELNHLQIPKPNVHQNPSDDDISVDISSWLEVGHDIYTPALPSSTDHGQELQHHILQLPGVEEEEDQILFDFDTTTTTTTPTPTNNNNNNSLHALLPTEDEEPPFLFENLFDFHNDIDQMTSTQQHNTLTYQYPLPQIPDKLHLIDPELPKDADEYYNTTFLLNDDELMNLVNITTEDNTCNDHGNAKTTPTVMSSSSNNDDHEAVTLSQIKRTNNKKIIGHVRLGDDEDDEADELMEPVEDDPTMKPSGSSTLSSNISSCSSKNLVSERNRRKRLGQQLLALRSLVPNITKMDKRSVLLDALAYLRRIHEETTMLQRELKDRHEHRQPTTTTTTTTMREESFTDDNSSEAPRIRPMLTPIDAASKPKFMITEIDTEKIENRRFIVKVTTKCSKQGGIGVGVGGEILRVIESLGFDITFTSLLQKNPQQLQQQREILIVLFIRVSKQEKMAEEKLRDCISNRALRLGLTFQNP